MSRCRVRAQVQEHWRAFDVLADSQAGGNEAIIRALDIFAGARGGFSGAREPDEMTGTAAAAAPAMSDALPGQQRGSDFSSLPRGTANAAAAAGGGGGGGVAGGTRRAYFSAEGALALAQEQLGRSEENLKLMEEEVERARQCIGSLYDTEDVDSRQERKDVRARASLQALDRGSFGCAMSPVDMVRAMAGLLRAHQSEFEMQETVVSGLGYDVPAEITTAYREALSLRPFMDDRFLSEVQEMRAISEELENSSKGECDEGIRSGP